MNRLHMMQKMGKICEVQGTRTLNLVFYDEEIFRIGETRATIAPTPHNKIIRRF